ncbi:hypothetical protein E5N72_04105 [Pseudoalteromonas sp. MEBiC 03607]|uniref:hypothetical protein n=1 Tax=unclassified Pseudoalteromonas TaxID=194690 RepID=UPI001093E9E7|nr:MULTISPECIES: hypothetical protein [unclassified Pseudoalteromonas]MCF2901376.1 hypothetical protein [Pseudoalteromonas sp. OFAV1]MCO7251782.1 hypothetical protein [Pseudoalteromonas sp. Ps84H-4]TGV19296.1 hypothetical protein E5N72_04105 [Pseudoalteromonas sp. MEBiC 03607]TMO40796.1 hypothetical protein CWC25_19855 [Pseudoalteromonas sp. S4389]
MKSNLLKYKNYLFVLSALIVANFVLDPMWKNIETLQQKVYLDESKVVKVENLIANKKQIEKQSGLLSINKLKLQPYLFTASTESEFKLTAQGKIEKLLQTNNCNVERIGWAGKSNIEQQLVRWTLEARFRGNPECVLNVSRQLESLEPMVKIADYSYAGKEVSGDKQNYMVVALTLIMWQNANEVAL